MIYHAYAFPEINRYTGTFKLFFLKHWKNTDNIKNSSMLIYYVNHLFNLYIKYLRKPKSLYPVILISLQKMTTGDLCKKNQNFVLLTCFPDKTKPFDIIKTYLRNIHQSSLNNTSTRVPGYECLLKTKTHKPV